MTERTNLYRKLAYAVVMAVLLFPLSLLGSPKTSDDKPGGHLAEFRHEHGLSQGNLGEIDPASETLKLATLGLRGVAANALWMKANTFKMKEDWGNLTATLEQLSKLQPNYITFWKYQAWNLTYNVSVEFDDYRDRYYYVRRGIEFLKKGETYNRDNPQILWELGWFIGQKIGRADEKVQYRRLFRNDDDFHPEDRPQEQRDNWLVGKEWYRKAEAAAETRGIGRKSPIVFYSSTPKSQMNYSEAIESEGRFGLALSGWRLADEEWADFGNRSLEHSSGTKLQLNSEDYLAEELSNARKELIALAPDVTGPFFEARRAKLTPEQRTAFDTPDEERDLKQLELARQAHRLMTPPDNEVVGMIATQRPALRVEALRQGEKIYKLADRHRKTKNYKQTANFDYWKLRCEFEQTANCVKARELCYRGKLAMGDDADPIRAAELYAEGLAMWKKVLEEYPKLLDADGTTGDDIMVFVKEYSRVLEKIDEEIPDDFPLWDIIEFFDAEQDMQEELNSHRQRMEAKQGETASSDVEPSETDSPDSNSAGAESAGAESAESEPTESEPVEPESTEVDSNGSESSGTEE